ncbi:LuxR C-terminal-related transcriptional regulator [Streptomyces griseoluteus]|uniref:LuxR C-terminal-related transcriptional regulator n=1 Tax=Streptomyces griseoluteus TaxID=29306 RepID=UPI00382FC93C
MLDSLGLDVMTESVYRALLSRPADGVADIAAHLGAAEDDVRGALDRLSGLSLVRPASDDIGQLHPVTPEIGLELLLARQQADLAAQQLRVEASRAAAAQLIAEHASLTPRTGSGVERLEGLDRIRDRLGRLTQSVRGEVMTLAPDGAHHPDSIEAAKNLNGEVLGRGVRMRTIYLDSARNSTHTLAYVNWLAALGGQVRTLPTLPTRLIIVDREQAVIPVNSDNSAAAALVLTSPGTLTALCALFDGLWQSANPLGDGPRHDPEGLTDTETAALRLLATGHTDESIAKRLGVSARTVRRITCGLMERLEARSRFEAGVRAAQRNWVS